MPSVTVRRIGADEWRALRSLRLAALAESPGAFAAAMADESGFDDGVWQDRARRGSSGAPSATFVAEGSAAGWATTDGQPLVGLVGGLLLDDAAEVDLFSMWVAPEARRGGVARRLVDAVTGWATGLGATTVALWVAADNVAAIAFYERCGFTRTGLEGPFPNHPLECEVRMARAL